jgi:Protein of unknown function (DUF2808)
MKISLVSALSALAITNSALLGLLPMAKADVSMNFSAPFITNSGIANASGDKHYFTVSVTGLPIEGLRVNIPNEMRILEGATVVDRDGNEIPVNVTTTEGQLDLNFSQPIQPENDLTVRLAGVNMDRLGGSVIYRVLGMEKGLRGYIPIGTAVVRLRDQT